MKLVNLNEMERIRIIKKKKNKGSGYIWGILIAIILLGAAGWILIDQDIIDGERLSLQRDTDKTEGYGQYNDSDKTENFDEFRDSEGFRDSEELQENSGSDDIKSYVKYVNREVVPAENIENQMKQKAVSLLQKAVNNVGGDSEFNQGNDADTSNNPAVSSDSNKVDGLIPTERSGPDSNQEQNNEDNRQNTDKSLIEAGNKLVDIQEREYPSLSKMGEVLDNSLNTLENNTEQETNDLKEFFIASSSLLQEIASERNELSYNNRRKYGNIE